MEDDPAPYHPASKKLREASVIADVWVEYIKRHPDEIYRIFINKNIPIEVYYHVYEKGNEYDHMHLAKKNNLPDDLREKLLNSIDEGVRGAIAVNRNTPKHMLEKLVDDPDPENRRIAKNRLGMTPEA